MRKATKVTLGLLAFLGVTGVALYFLRQAKLLKQVCISSTNLNWVQTLINAYESVSADVPTPLEVDYSLTLENNSNIDVEIKSINLGIFTSDGRIGTISNEFSEVLPKKSSLNLPLNISLDPISGSGVVSLAIDQLIGGIEMEIRGNIELKASIFETINYPYRLRFNSSNLSEGVETSGNCT